MTQRRWNIWSWSRLTRSSVVVPGIIASVVIVGLVTAYGVRGVLQARSASSLHVFVESMEDLRPGGHRDNFGWGGMQRVFRAAQELSPFVHRCRQYHHVGKAISYAFEVKVSPDTQSFLVVGISRGADTNAAMAACLRNEIAAARVSELSHVRAIAADSYTLTLGVRGNLGVTNQLHLNE